MPHRRARRPKSPSAATTRAPAARARSSRSAASTEAHHPHRTLTAEEAQVARWSVFERSLSGEHLRAYLKGLPAFEDVEAEERALDHAQGFASPPHALDFLVAWPALDRAAALVVQRAEELDGDHYEVLTPAADALAGKHSLAATLVLRAMIDFALSHSRSSRYRHAARHLTECASLASSVPDWGTVEPHEAYVARLKAEHGRKSSFWSLVV